MPKYLGYFEDLLAANGGTYVTGRRLTYVDLSLFQIVEGLRYAFPKRMKAFERENSRPRRTTRPRCGAAEHQGVSGERSKDCVQRGGDLPQVQGAGCLRASFRGVAKRRTRNLEIPRCAIAHLRFDATHRPGMTASPSTCSCHPSASSSASTVRCRRCSSHSPPPRRCHQASCRARRRRRRNRRRAGGGSRAC